MSLPELKKKAREELAKRFVEDCGDEYTCLTANQTDMNSFLDSHLEEAYEAGRNSLFEETFIEKNQ
jgi:hypothetical protein